MINQLSTRPIVRTFTFIADYLDDETLEPSKHYEVDTPMVKRCSILSTIFIFAVLITASPGPAEPPAQEPDQARLAEADSLNNLAHQYYARGSYAQAEPLLRQALDINKSALGEEHPYYTISLNYLASLYKKMGSYDQAEPLYKQALDIRRRKA